MNITEVRIFEKKDADKKLRAFVTVTFENCFVVRDIKVIEGAKGLFVAMPSRRLREPCPKCGHPSELSACYCSHCGASIGKELKLKLDSAAHQSEHKDIAHPITSEFREYIQKTILEAYKSQKKISP